MKAIMIMFDSLNRHMLPPYGGEWVHAPNFERLVERTVIFDKCYVGSMPCMPARRELHTGRYNFLHRSWGPIEPFDDSMPQILKENGVHSHLVTDHQHYWEDGGATYHNRYTTYEFVRGQEGDLWKGVVARDPNTKPTNPYLNILYQDQINRTYITSEAMMPQARTFESGMEFIKTNHEADNWFLQLETFDPHEPFFTQDEWKELYPHEYDGPPQDWPPYDRVTQGPDVVRHMQSEYAALMSMCDHYLGKVLDLMDELGLWNDTMLIVNTDHGYLLGEHDWWAKTRMPWYNELANIPLFIWDPRSSITNQRRNSLVQTIDLPATILEFFGLECPPDMLGQPLRQTIVDDTAVRDYALFGMFNAHVNITDGRYIYMRANEGDDVTVYNYTLMPTHMRQLFTTQELQSAEMREPFSFTKDCPVMKIPSVSNPWQLAEFDTLLFDIQADPKQANPMQSAEIEARMAAALVEEMKRNDAPVEQFQRLGLQSVMTE
ncbi:MAG: sulfatase [Anaerolineae bacterium]|nr:sulfatase [Anaerolineae bacterium]MCB9458680.1 sulfatase [Anaerolineaceae bacterium]